MASLLDKAKELVAEKVVNVPVPDASVNDVDLLHFNRDSLEIEAKIDVDNPYPCSIPICEISYLLKSASRVIASGKIADPGSIKAKDKTLLKVPVKAPYGIVMNIMKDIGSDCDIDYELEIGLIIDLPVVGNITIPLSKKGEIKLPSVSEMIFGKKDEDTVES
jgi:LEA14-like dessication related protein